jgi:hypothetical protein
MDDYILVGVGSGRRRRSGAWVDCAARLPSAAGTMSRACLQLGTRTAAVPIDWRRVAVAVAGFLGRYKGQSRVHTASDLRVFLTWCAERAWTL